MAQVYLTHSLEKPFTLNFRLGPLVGVVQETKARQRLAAQQRAAAVVLQGITNHADYTTRMLQHIDVAQADATNPDDYKKCLVYRIMGEIENFKSREGTGPKALNQIVKAMLGSQAQRRSDAIFTLARRGDLQAVKRALDLSADPNIPDTLGITVAISGEGPRMVKDGGSRMVRWWEKMRW
eukprot:Skav226423  [mRNA]  locus=scaffold872:56510:61189:+ [translate_table: standard]